MQVKTSDDLTDKFVKVVFVCLFLERTVLINILQIKGNVRTSTSECLIKGFPKMKWTLEHYDSIHSDGERHVVACHDTDVLLVLVSHFDKLSFKELWITAGISKKPNWKYLTIHPNREGVKKQFLKGKPFFHSMP